MIQHMNDDFLKGKTVLSVLSTNDFIEDNTVQRKLIINSIYVATGMPYNRVDKEFGDLIDHCLKNHYNDRCTMGAVMARLWQNYVADNDEEYED